ncbi:hypothetical protein Nepgr_017818 [Nepenthes gracilis]|uniref:Uncharacterized protein n=1 Tax=Nepenthes gracilis TaxID=150966 RepID=A0AAD3ST01_NEPGR|nr:hypothetical protein Nepgr_017818 [Nepenthes gracilis]
MNSLPDLSVFVQISVKSRLACILSRIFHAYSSMKLPTVISHLKDSFEKNAIKTCQSLAVIQFSTSSMSLLPQKPARKDSNAAMAYCSIFFIEVECNSLAYKCLGSEAIRDELTRPVIEGLEEESWGGAKDFGDDFGSPWTDGYSGGGGESGV